MSDKFRLLPFEIIEKVLLLLLPQDIAKCKQVSRLFDDVIRVSTPLQYLIECHLARVLDNPTRQDVPLSDRLQRLRRWRRALESGEWPNESQEDVLQTEDDVFAAAYGTAYVVRSGSMITITQLPSTFRRRQEKQWILQDVSFSPVDLAYDHMEHLLVLAESDDSGRYRIHFLSPDTGGPHPLAAVPTIIVPTQAAANLDPVIYGSSCKVEVYSPFVAVTTAQIRDDTTLEVLVFNWKTGAVHLNVYTAPYYHEDHSVAFLDVHHVVLPVFGTLRANEDYTTGVAIVCIQPGNQNRRAWHEAIQEETSLFLELRKIAYADSAFSDLAVYSRPSSIPSCPPYPEDLFVQDPCSTLIGISFKISGSELVTGRAKAQCYDIFVPAAAILSLLSTHNHVTGTRLQNGIRSIVWQDWAKYTRVFPVEISARVRPGVYPLCGSRLLWWTLGGAGKGVVFIRDFALPGTLANTDERNVTKPTRIIEPLFWHEILECGAQLPYRQVPSRIRLGAFDEVVFGDDFLVVIRTQAGGSLGYRKETYWI